MNVAEGVVPRELAVKDPIFNVEGCVNEAKGSGLVEVIATGVA
jgi:hypothetical protein